MAKNNSEQKVIFRRVRGRLVPIRVSKSENGKRKALAKTGVGAGGVFVGTELARRGA